MEYDLLMNINRLLKKIAHFSIGDLKNLYRKPRLCMSWFSTKFEFVRFIVSDYVPK